MIDLKETIDRLRDHMTAITVSIGERSMFSPDKLSAAASYIEAVYRSSGLEVELESYPCTGYTAANVVALSSAQGAVSGRYLVGAHYDTILGSVGADDNASAVAVQLEAARQLHAMRATREIPVSVKFVSFALEEYPAYATRYMGSRVHARGMRARKEKLDGMICLEMVGFYCGSPGCQRYPLPLRWRNYPRQGDFISVVGNGKSRKLVRGLVAGFRKNPGLAVLPLTVPLNGWIMPAVRLSDHAPFWNEGFPAVMVTDTSFFRNPHYHLPSDTMDKLNFEMMAELVESLLLFLLS